MTKEKKTNIAKALTAQLRTAEGAIDTALSESANLIEACISSRRAIHISTISGVDVHKNTLKAMTALAEAQTHMSATHAVLDELRNSLGLTTLIAPIFDKPPMTASVAICAANAPQVITTLD
jgi:hypothetical protein